METRTRGKGAIDRGLQGSMEILADANPTKLSKQSQAVPLQSCLVSSEGLVRGQLIVA